MNRNPDAELLGVLEAARARGFLGPGPLDLHIRHAEGFAEILRRELPPASPTTVVDLGSGGGLPGFVLAERLPDSVHLVLVEVSAKRAAFLREMASSRPLWIDRVSVVEQRAEEVGRDLAVRGAADAVVARSFGPPAVVAECAAPLLKVGGVLVVSEPPPESADDPGSSDGHGKTPSERWPTGALAELGLEVSPEERGEFGYRVLRQVETCPERYPRRVGVPTKRPLF